MKKSSADVKNFSERARSENAGGTQRDQEAAYWREQEAERWREQEQAYWAEQEALYRTETPTPAAGPEDQRLANRRCTGGQVGPGTNYETKGQVHEP